MKNIFFSLCLLLSPCTLLNAGCQCDPCLCDPCHCNDAPSCRCLTVGADILIWTACQKDLTFGQELKVQELPDIMLDQLTFDFKNADYDWQPGWRVYGEYALGCYDNLGFRAVYTHWENDATGKITEEGIGGESPFSGILDALFPKLNARNKLDYNVLDLLLTYNYQLNCDFSVDPYFGFRAIWLDQHGVIISEERDIRVTGESDLFARGIAMGTVMNFDLCGGFGIFAKVGGSILEGSYDNSIKGELGRIFLIDSILNEESCAPVASADAAIGVNFGCVKFGCDGEYEVNFSLGYEMNYWFCIADPFNLKLNLQTDLLLPENVMDKKSLLLHGVTLGVNFNW